MKDGHSFSEVWRRFEEHPLTHSMAHYILAISELRDERGYARATDVAKRLGVTKGSASTALRTIREKGFVTEDENRMLFLTQRGRDALDTIVSTRSTFLNFFRDILAIDEHIALEDACKLEHLVSRVTSERLLRFIKFVMMEKNIKEKIQNFRENVALCQTVDVCGHCHSFDECAAHLVDRATHAAPKRRRRTAASS